MTEAEFFAELEANTPQGYQKIASDIQEAWQSRGQLTPRQAKWIHDSCAFNKKNRNLTLPDDILVELKYWQDQDWKVQNKPTPTLTQEEKHTVARDGLEVAAQEILVVCRDILKEIREASGRVV